MYFCGWLWINKIGGHIISALYPYIVVDIPYILVDIWITDWIRGVTRPSADDYSSVRPDTAVLRYRYSSDVYLLLSYPVQLYMSQNSK